MWKLSKKKVSAFAVLLALLAVFNVVEKKEQLFLLGRTLKEDIVSSDLPCCKVSSERCVWQKVPPFTIPQCEKENLVDILRWLDYVLDVEWMITAGTLLGAVREQGHIPFETDIDIVMDRKDWKIARKQIKSRLSGTHFSFWDDIENNEFKPAKLYFSTKNRIHVDIWFFDRISNEVVSEITSISKNRYRKVNVTADMIYPLSQCEYDGHHYPCPNQSERWVELRYGNDWRTPKPKYSPNPLFKDGDDNGFLLGKGMTG